MASKRKAEDFPPGIQVEDGHAQIDEGISEIPSKALMKCFVLKEVSLPLSVRIIGDYCFAQCTGLKIAKIPNSVEVIGKAAFFYCTNMTDVAIARDQPRLRVIGTQAFHACRALKSIETPESVVEIGPKAFGECLDLLSVAIHGQNVRTIKKEAFCGCSSLAEVILPSSLTSIGNKAFHRCRKLHTIRQSQGPQVGPSAKGGCFSSIVHVGVSSFEGCKSLESMVLSETIRTIHVAAFKDCENLQEFEFPEGLEVIEDQGMAGVRRLGFARLPTTLVRIGHQAFAACTYLQTVIMPPSESSRLQSVGHQAFVRCLSLRNICFPSGAEIQPNAVNGCDTLHNLLLRRSHRDWGHSLIGPLITRFDGLPLLGLCYHQSYYSSGELRGRLTKDGMAGGARKADIFGMTALHLLALSKTSNLDVWKCVMEENPSNLIATDTIGHLALGYLLLHYCEPAVLDVYFAARHELNPFESHLQYIVQNTLPYSRDKLRTIVTLSVDRRVRNVPERWKQDIMDGVDRLCGSSTSAERVRRVSHLQNKILGKYQMKEMSSLLELAVWNAKIDESTSSESTTTEEKSNEFRQNCRLQCGDEVIIRNVLPFLWFLEESSPESNESLINGESIPDFRYETGQSVRYVEPPPQPVNLASMFGLFVDFEY